MNLDDDTYEVDELPAPARKEIPAADRELLELAARALGAGFEEVDGEGYGNLHFADGSVVHAWNSLEFSGDTFDLAVELDILVGACLRVNLIGDKHANARRAVTRAAAEIGKSMG